MRQTAGVRTVGSRWIVVASSRALHNAMPNAKSISTVNGGSPKARTSTSNSDSPTSATRPKRAATAARCSSSG